MLIKIVVKAGARNESLKAVSADRLEISVKEKARGGSANRRSIELLARQFACEQERLRIVRGRRSPSKIVELL